MLETAPVLCEVSYLVEVKVDVDEKMFCHQTERYIPALRPNVLVGARRAHYMLVSVYLFYNKLTSQLLTLLYCSLLSGINIAPSLMAVRSATEASVTMIPKILEFYPFGT